MRQTVGVLSILGVAAFVACREAADSPNTPVSAIDAGAEAGPSIVKDGDYTWILPAGFPKPQVPADNPMSIAKVELGRHLFYDTRFSLNKTQSCATCHEQAHAFADTRARGLGSTGELHPRGAMSLANIGYATVFTWANDLFPNLEKQARTPIFGEDPIELGMSGQEEELLTRLRGEPRYQELFPKAFPILDDVDGEAGSEVISIDHALKALATFQRSLLSGASAFDRYQNGGDPAALSPAAVRGRELFQSERLECFHCHGGFNFADSVAHAGTAVREMFFHNTGLYNLDGAGAYPADNVGLAEVSKKPEDMGRFKAPTLRNIAVTAPYMHDGSIATLADVIDHYAAGGRTIATGPNAGDGSKSPRKSEFMKGFILSGTERDDLLAFLQSLTDETFLIDPKYGDPWVRP